MKKTQARKTDTDKISNADGAIENFKAVCRRAGLRVTLQRVAVYEHILGSKEHPSATMVFEQVRKKYPEVSLDTVNRTLATITELGLANMVPGDGRAKRFDADVAHHQHFCCVRCGKIYDFECAEFENMKLPRHIREKFKVLTKTVFVQGICDKCR
ncbi:MAG: transcriptional repressor [Phycisphaerae bacterium]|jgi:Fur family peroxide stress response transcriptional regulator